ncbi:major facilitator superfamily domain-containing protein [Spinellus fusiger]|nr:major facilitator superfamily domain-containing protein [Spinellus fusiger]
MSLYPNDREEDTPLLKSGSPPTGYNSVVLENADTDAEDDIISVVSVQQLSSSKPVAPQEIEESSNDIVARRLNGASLFAVLCALCISVVLSALDSSIVATVYAQIGTEFKKSNEIIWIATSYMLSYTALQPLYGRISDVFGRKNALMFAVTIFFVGSFFCGAATGLWSLIIARAIAGIGGGGVNTMTSVIISDLVPLRERGKFQGYCNVAYSLGCIVGAPLGGFLTDNFGWRYCFYINLPLLLITIYISYTQLTNYNLIEEEIETTLYERIKKIDYLGAITIVLAVVCFLLATSLGGNLRAWSDPLVVGSLIGSVLFIVMFYHIEAKVSENPLMPYHIISSRTPLACSFVNFWSLMCSTAMIYIIPLYFQTLLGYTSTKAGLFFLPKAVVVSIGSVFSGVYISRTGEYRNITIIASIASLVSMIGFSLWTPSTPLVFMIGTLMLDGFSMGIIVTTVLVGMLTCVSQKEMATIVSMSYLFRSAGSVMGVSATSAIFQAIIKSKLTLLLTGDNAKYIEVARRSVTEVRELLPPDVLEIVLGIYQIALYYAFLSCVLMAVISLICTLFIQRFELNTSVKK